MLHMVAASHNPESCPSNAHVRDSHFAALDKFGEVAKAKAIDVRGTWVDPPGHMLFVLAEAPNAHTVVEALAESGMMAFYTTRIHAVFEPARVRELLG